jgi:hypothetical protein
MYAHTNRDRDNPSPAQSWHDFGDGFGAKSSSLKDNVALLSTAGFKIPTIARIGTSITNEIIETIRKTAVLIDSDSAAFFPTESISAAHPSLAKIVQDALNALNNPPYVAVRSDPFGDDTGIGVYESFLVDTRDVNKVIEAVIRVVGSHEIEEAVAFRRELNLKDGIAVMIQPVVGDSYETLYENLKGTVKAFGPAWSLTLQVGGAQVEAFAVPGLGSPMDPLLYKKQLYLQSTGNFFSGTSELSSRANGSIIGHGLCQSDEASSVQAVAMPQGSSKILGTSTSRVKDALAQLRSKGRQYLEVCIDWRGELHAIQYGMVEIPPLEDQAII